MKTRNFLTILVVGCLFSCQQNEKQDEKDAMINFSISIDNDNLTTALTRSGATYLHNGKMSFSTGDVISLSTSNNDFSSFAIGKDVRNWKEVGTNAKRTTFYAHYQELMGNESEGKRNLQGGNEYLFGYAEASTGANRINLQFKRMTVPVILLDEQGKPYEGKSIIKLYLKNQGMQDLKKGTITATDSKKENIEVKKLTDGILTNLIPQTIEKGEVFASITSGGKTRNISAPRTLSLDPEDPFKIKVSGPEDIIIIEDEVPLRR